MSHLKTLREAKGLRREDVASRAGISYDYVRKLEVEGGTPGLDIARAVARTLDATVDEVFPPEPSPVEPLEATTGSK